MDKMPDRLLAADDREPVIVSNEDGGSPFLIVADHAGNSVPRAFGRLGVPETELGRHIAWDIGIGAVSRLAADTLDATMVAQNYSRLVIDCNRFDGHPCHPLRRPVCQRTVRLKSGNALRCSLVVLCELGLDRCSPTRDILGPPPVGDRDALPRPVKLPFVMRQNRAQ